MALNVSRNNLYNGSGFRQIPELQDLYNEDKSLYFVIFQANTWVYLGDISDILSSQKSIIVFLLNPYLKLNDCLISLNTPGLPGSISNIQSPSNLFFIPSSSGSNSNNNIYGFT